MERRVEAALERFTLERVAEELERTVDELLVPTTRRVDVPVLLRLTCPEVVLLRRTVCPPFTVEERREVEDDTLFPA